MFDLAEVDVTDASVSFADCSLEELNDMDVSLLSDREMELFTTRMLELESLVADDDSPEVPDVAGMVAELSGDIGAMRELEIKHDSVEDLADALAESAIVLGSEDNVTVHTSRLLPRQFKPT